MFVYSLSICQKLVDFWALFTKQLSGQIAGQCLTVYQD